MNEYVVLNSLFLSGRDVLRAANARLRLVLNEVLKTTAAAEETIARHVGGVLDASGQTHINTHCSRTSLVSSEIIRFIVRDGLIDVCSCVRSCRSGLSFC